MVLISLVPALTPFYLYVSTFRSMCAVPNTAIFCSSLTLWFPGMLVTYFLHDFEMVPVPPIITGIAFVFTFHMRLFIILIIIISFTILFKGQEKQLDTREVNFGGTEIITCAFIPARKNSAQF